MNPGFYFLPVCLLATAVQAIPVPGKPIQAGINKVVNGVVMDKDNKPLKNVNITAIEQLTNLQIVTTSNGDGGYKLLLLQPGTYRLIFEKQGYKKVLKEKVYISPDKEPAPVFVEMPLTPMPERGPSVWHFFDS